MMKTIGELFEEHTRSFKEVLYVDMPITIHPKDLLNLTKAVHVQAVDLCMENVEIGWHDDKDGMYGTIEDHSILKVKDMLK